MIKRLSLLLLLVGLFLINPHCANVEQNQNIIKSVKVKEVPFKDVRSSIWKKAPVTQVNVIPQNMTLPSLQTPTIQYINVRSLHNDNWIAFLLEWDGKTILKRVIEMFKRFIQITGLTFTFSLSR